MDRFICIHGHFYQPPRENPWIEEVEVEDSAYPYHDWNARITAECYAPNTASRILDSNKKIIDIVNNYAAISFDFGPTLLMWLERSNPEVYAAILEADRESQKKFSGHGSAIAQAYNHLIMPLANQRDKRTQVIWGIRDFSHRFGRMPEGMWLPETAVDNETLEIMAGQGILFTILSPSQAARVKKTGESGWTDTSRETLDCSLPYTCRLPGGKSIVIFFYDDGLAQELAFGSLLNNGDEFAGRMMRAFSRYPESALVSVASDGETYGHHHRFADMALAYAIYQITEKEPVAITIFGEYLASHPPTHEVEIHENSSWSCPHGIERWRSDCGCCTRGTVILDTDLHPPEPVRVKITPDPRLSCTVAWHQEWRNVLRTAMDQLRDELMPVFETRMGSLVTDPCAARDDYITVILDRSKASRERFLLKHASRILSDDEKSLVLKLLEMQRYAMLMYTSCGWFFDDISGIETLQVMTYSCRAIQIAKEISGTDYEPLFISSLLEAKSNTPEQADGATIYRNYVRQSMIDPTRMIFNYAIITLITGTAPPVIMHYTKTAKILETAESGETRMMTGTVSLRSEITGDEKTFEFAVFRRSTYEFMGGVREYRDDDQYSRMRNRLRFALKDPETLQLISTMEKEFGTATYSLWHLFKDAQREILFRLLDSTLMDLESSFRQIYRQHITLIHAMKEMRIPVPVVIENPVWYIINRDLNEALLEKELNHQKIRTLVNELIHGQFSPDKSILDFTASNAIASHTKALAARPDDLDILKDIIGLFSTLAPLELKYELWQSQNDYFFTGKKQLTSMQKRAAGNDPLAAQWVSHFRELGKWLGVNCL
jgi:alpha-amylase/alpha-mannosidase (GH57 family)